jgi:general stress protein 26
MEPDKIIQIIESLVDHQDVCFLSFINDAGFPTTRTMLNPRKRQGIKEFYLTTNSASQKVQSLLANPRAGLYFYDRPTYRGAAFTGTVEVIQDQAIKDEIWRDMDTIFYESNTDPNYCVLKFTATAVRYYQDYTSTNIDL